MEVTLNRPHGPTVHESVQNASVTTQHGLTLIELLLAIAIIAILLGAGIPSVSALIRTNRMAAAMNSLSDSFALARSEAVMRKQEIVICTSRDGMVCTRKGGWEQGWIIFDDQNNNERRDKGEVRFRVQGALPPGIEISFAAFHSNHFVHYYLSGFTKMNGTFTFCMKHHPQLTKALILNKIGRLRISKTQDDGSPLECG